MKLLHHVKKHWKTITLHLKKHHKKYIFWILSATLLWKWVSLIAAYAVIHNLSFSFADVIHEWDENNGTEIEITNEYEGQTDTNDEESNELYKKFNRQVFTNEPKKPQTQNAALGMLELMGVRKNGRQQVTLRYCKHL